MGTLKINTQLRFSRFLHILDLENGAAAFYNALNQAVIYTTSEFAGRIQNSQKPFRTKDLLTQFDSSNGRVVRGIVRQLWHYKMLLEPGEDEMLDVAALRSFLDEPQIAILYLLLTDACNIACGYCYFEGSIPENYRFSLMSFETARGGIDLFAKVYAQDLLETNREGPHIVLYGGEPLLNWPVVKAVLGYIEEQVRDGVLPLNTKITLNTNATLITPEIAQILALHKVNVAVSLDGPRKVHNSMRVDHSGKGTFDDVVSRIRMLREMGAMVGTCCTIDDHNINQLEDITRWMIDDLGFDTLGFNTLLESDLRPIPNPDYYGKTVAQKLVSCFKIAREMGVYEDRFMRKVRAFIEGDYYFADCGGCGMQIVVAPDGEIGTCQGFCGTRKYFAKPNEYFDPRTHPYWREWRRRSPINMESCLDCIALANCGGGCPHNSYVKHGDIWQLDGVFCPQAIYAVKFLIKDLYEQKNPMLVSES